MALNDILDAMKSANNYNLNRSRQAEQTRQYEETSRANESYRTNSLAYNNATLFENTRQADMLNTDRKARLDLNTRQVEEVERQGAHGRAQIDNEQTADRVASWAFSGENGRVINVMDNLDNPRLYDELNRKGGMFDGIQGTLKDWHAKVREDGNVEFWGTNDKGELKPLSQNRLTDPNDPQTVFTPQEVQALFEGHVDKVMTTAGRLSIGAAKALRQSLMDMPPEQQAARQQLMDDLVPRAEVQPPAGPSLEQPDFAATSSEQPEQATAFAAPKMVNGKWQGREFDGGTPDIPQINLNPLSNFEFKDPKKPWPVRQPRVPYDRDRDPNSLPAVSRYGEQPVEDPRNRDQLEAGSSYVASAPWATKGTQAVDAAGAPANADLAAAPDRRRDDDRERDRLESGKDYVAPTPWSNAATDFVDAPPAANAPASQVAKSGETPSNVISQNMPQGSKPNAATGALTIAQSRDPDKIIDAANAGGPPTADDTRTAFRAIAEGPNSTQKKRAGHAVALRRAGLITDMDALQKYVRTGQFKPTAPKMMGSGHFLDVDGEVKPLGEASTQTRQEMQEEEKRLADLNIQRLGYFDGIAASMTGFDVGDKYNGRDTREFSTLLNKTASSFGMDATTPPQTIQSVFAPAVAGWKAAKARGQSWYDIRNKMTVNSLAPFVNAAWLQVEPTETGEVQRRIYAPIQKGIPGVTPEKTQHLIRDAIIHRATQAEAGKNMTQDEAIAYIVQKHNSERKT